MKPQRGRRVLSILSVALVTAGAVILADAAATLAWKEPVSTLYGELQQRAAAGELEDLESSFAEVTLAGDAAGPQRPRAKMARLARTFSKRLPRLSGEGIGRLKIPQIDLDWVMVEGTTQPTLRKGPGRYPRTGLPGSGRTIGIAGHRTTYGAPFKRINELERGDEVTVKMPYGRLRYKVTKAKIVEPTRVEVVRDVGRERDVLTACHPLYSADKRIVLFARLASVSPS